MSSLRARKTKVSLHKDLNKAYAELLSIALGLNCQAYYNDLKKGRAFLSSKVDNSDHPPC